MIALAMAESYRESSAHAQARRAAAPPCICHAARGWSRSTQHGNTLQYHAIMPHSRLKRRPLADSIVPRILRVPGYSPRVHTTSS